jgi:hypothetical protein
MRISLKVGLAFLLAVGLLPLAMAHECQPGETSVDPSHRVVVHCEPFGCVVMDHVCVGFVEAARADAALLP